MEKGNAGMAPRMLAAFCTVLILAACGAPAAEPTTAPTYTPPPTDVPITGDTVRGGLLYDKWWDVLEAEAPEGNHPLWATQTTNTRTGPDTWRCKECHGWDYLGAEGAYGSGSHFTGFPGVFGTGMTAQEFVAALTGGTNPDHDFSALVEPAAINDLAVFLSEALIDDREYVDYASREAAGDPTKGAQLYEGSCATCHGADGRTLNFGDEDQPEFVGTIAVDNPWEFLHKVRFGQPGSSPEMPSGIEAGWTAQDAADVLSYAATLPVEAAISQAAIRGGLLYDKWWDVLGAEAPEGNHPLWSTQTTNTRTGGDTWRCKECHGWDYLGPEGAYGSGSHFTGFPGVFGTGMTTQEFASALAGGTNPDHDFSALLEPDAIDDLAIFLTEALVDERGYIDYKTKTALAGDAAVGQVLYSDTCVICHGEDGRTMNFGSADEPEFVGTIALDNPWEFVHKVRFGQPGSSPEMPSGVEAGWDIEAVIHLLVYAQTLPIGAP